MPIDRDVPLDWDALPDPVPTPPPARPSHPPHVSPVALNAQERIELDTLRYNRDHFGTVALKLKADLDDALTRLAACTCGRKSSKK
jgi:hypothetical protein